MIAKELAQRLDGRERGREISREESAEAKASGLTVVYGASDDLLEFEGAIYDEVGGYEGCIVHLLDGKLVYCPEERCEDMDGCPFYRAKIAKAKRLEAVWRDEGNPCWTIKTDIPHETFNIHEDGELCCIGIVFDVTDTMEQPDKPLTIDELRGMEGEPVWATSIDGKYGGWMLVGDGYCDAIEGMESFDDYGTTWIAYRHKPGGANG